MCDGKCSQSQEDKEGPVVEEVINGDNQTIKLLIVALLIQSAMLAGVAWKAIDLSMG